MKEFIGNGNELEWEIVADYYKLCIDCNIHIAAVTKNMSRKDKEDFTHEWFMYDNCQNHTHLYQKRKTKLYHDSNNNSCYGLNVPKKWRKYK
jgi:hypothetical protein